MLAPFAAGLLVGFVLTIAGLLLWARAAEPVEGEWERMSRKDFGDAPKLPPTFRDSTIADFEPLHSTTIGEKGRPDHVL